MAVVAQDGAGAGVAAQGTSGLRPCPAPQPPRHLHQRLQLPQQRLHPCRATGSGRKGVGTQTEQNETWGWDHLPNLGDTHPLDLPHNDLSQSISLDLPRSVPASWAPRRCRSCSAALTRALEALMAAMLAARSSISASMCRKSTFIFRMVSGGHESSAKSLRDLPGLPRINTPQP